MKQNILIIEDTKDIRDELCDILCMEGFEVLEADNGKDGFDLAKKELPKLIISDIMMPGIDGFELYELLAKNAHTGQIPVIFLSARANPEALEKSRSIGATDYLVKPVEADTLLKVVYKVLNLKFV